MRTIITTAGDTVDYVAWRHYGSTSNRVVEALLDANRGLADLGPVLPAGVRIVLPEVSQTTQRQGVRLWE